MGMEIYFLNQELIMVSMVVYRAVFDSLIVKNKSSFTATNTVSGCRARRSGEVLQSNSADPVGLLHFVVNEVVFSAVDGSEH